MEDMEDIKGLRLNNAVIVLHVFMGQTQDRFMSYVDQ